ncbi:MAG: DUF3754 domain-containing protein [Pseudomonadota bacterium]
MDAIADTQEPRATSRFIPLTRQAVIADLCNDPGLGAGRDTFAKLALRLQKHRGHKYRLLAEEMRRCYLPFSPDRDTVRVLSFSDAEKDEMQHRLSDLTSHLLTRANYQKLDTEELNAILNREGPYSLNIEVDLREYDEMLLFVRDVYTDNYSVRRPETFFLKRTYDIRVYRRLFVLLKLKSVKSRAAEIAETKEISPSRAERIVRRRRKQLPKATSSDFIYMKMFKDMPEHDLQILYPLRVVQFRPFDKIKFLATAGGGTAFGIFSTTGKLLAATNPIAMVGALFGFIGLLARQVTVFFNQRTRYMMELAQKLFFHNLANNRAALTLLLDRAEEEDVKEDLIALYFSAGEIVPKAELASRKRKIDEIVLTRYGIAIDFEMNDAVNRLKDDGAVIEEGDALRFLSLEEASALYARLIDADDSDDAKHICDRTEVAELDA